MWTDEQIKDHKTAAELLIKVKNITFSYIRNNRTVSEYDTHQFILKKFKEFDLITDKDPPIVAFNTNSATPEFYPKIDSERLKPDTFILIDIWAKLNKKNAPFADITWVAYYGDNIPKKVQNVFNVVLKARDSTLNFVKQGAKEGKIPTGKEVDKVARDIIEKEGFNGKFLHGTGHSIGTTSPHGNRGNLNTKGKKRLSINLGYTIEPGIYLENEFGVRSEMDFYINKKNKLVLTTPIQKNIIKI